MAVTINDVKKNKIALESAIMKLAQDFEKDNGVYVSYINFDRKREKDKETVSEPVEYHKEKGPIKNITVNMDLDLIY